jgi:ABC-type nickel/cobalt efflux system permease component RcnA
MDRRAAIGDRVPAIHRGSAMRRFIFALVCTSFCTPAAIAHPVPKTNRDRTIVVRVTANALVVDYRLEIDEGSIPEELPSLGKLSTREEILERFTTYFADVLGRNLDASLDDAELQFECTQHKFVATDHVRCVYRFVAPWKLAPGTEHKLKFHDANFVLDTISRLCVYLGADDSISLTDAKVPTAELMNRPSDQRKPGDTNILSRAAARFELAAIEQVGAYKPSFPPDDLTLKDDGGIGTGPAALKPTGSLVETASKPAPAETVGESKSPPAKTKTPSVVETLPVPAETLDASGPSTVAEPESLWQQITAPNALIRLLNSDRWLPLLLAIAAAAGAAHAVQPGHGKTVVAAYLVGDRGTYWHAVVLGVVTTLTHTAAVLVLAVLIQFLPGNKQQFLTGQEMIGGLLITALGLWLLFRRLTGQADHFHIGGGHHHHGPGGHHHHHHHGHGGEDHTHATDGTVIPARSGQGSLWGVITLGIGGGIVPCVEPVALLGYAVAQGKTQLALPLVLAFSAGLATVLIALGISVVGAKQIGKLAAPSSTRMGPLVRVLPILSALVVTVMGVWLCREALNPH